MAGVTPEEKLLNVIKKAQGKMKLKKELHIFTKVNFILIGLIIIIVIIFLIDVLTAPSYKGSEIAVDLPEQEALPAAKNLDEEFEDIEIDTREASRVSKGEMLQDLNLLGVITGDDNQAIIEDKKTKRTFFLYKGDSFREFKVYDIREGSVTLDYEGEKIELKM